MKDIKSVCVYCGSSVGNSPLYQEAAVQLGKEIAQHGLRLVYGGGTKGLMGIVAHSVQENGGHVTGIIPEFLLTKEATQEEIEKFDNVVITQTMHERKFAMFEQADAFITLPGGIGTLEEVIEMMTWAQLEQHDKPIILANIDNFWDPLLKLLEYMSEKGFLHTNHRVRPFICNDIKDIFSCLTNP